MVLVGGVSVMSQSGSVSREEWVGLSDGGLVKLGFESGCQCFRRDSD